jgi:hypothetical protein
MAPAPGHRIAHDHEAGDLIDRVVHPARLEGGAVAAFVPARVGGRAVEHAIDEEERHAPPRAPEPVDAPEPGKATSRPSQMRVSRIAGPSERCISSFISLRGIVGVIPLGRSQAGLDGDARARGRAGCSRAPKTSRSWLLPPWKSAVPRWANGDRSLQMVTHDDNSITMIVSIIFYHDELWWTPECRSGHEQAPDHHPISPSASGVSVATVDRVLNGRLPVREETAAPRLRGRDIRSAITRPG